MREIRQNSLGHITDPEFVAKKSPEIRINQKSLLRILRSDFFLFRPDRFVKSFANGPCVGCLRSQQGADRG